MKLVTFSVSNFRSITTAKKVSLSNYSVLIGANNEGKSNILHAMAIGLEAIEKFHHTLQRDTLGRLRSISGQFRVHSARLHRSPYDWELDFPMSKQHANNAKDLYTEIILEFELNKDEIDEFILEIGSKLNGNLPISIKFYPNRGPNISISKQGLGGSALTKKANKVADFVSRRVNFEYIPAIRTSDSAQDVIAQLVSKELNRLDSNASYKKARQQIEEAQAPLLESLSKTVRETVSSFLPSVKNVTIQLQPESRYRHYRREITIVVDDGNKTPLERKGDGVKSLVALALMRHASTVSAGAGMTVIAIEEPEAHLHPHAVHELREVLVGLSAANQVILTSHSPLFVNPANLGSTIVVHGNRAGPAKNIEEVRKVLWVRLSDNLQSARLVAVVEGDDDVTTLKAIAKWQFPRVWDAIECGHVAFDAMGGASNLSYKVRAYRSAASLVQCLLDNDVAGKSAVDAAMKDGIIKTNDYNLFTAPGLIESELEDLFDINFYRDDFLREFGVDIGIRSNSGRKRKWSESIGSKFCEQGKNWDKRTKSDAKILLARVVSDKISEAVVSQRMLSVEAFFGSIEKKLFPELGKENTSSQI